MSDTSEKIRNEIIEEARKRGFFARNIGYQEFLELYRPYQNMMKEQEVAEILGISYYRLHQMKSRGTKTKSTIEKCKVISQKSIQDIQEEIRAKGYNENSTISYEEFLRLYEPYKTEMREAEFAEILGISYSNWKNMRHAGSRANIFRKSSTPISEERVRKIQEEIRKQGYANRAISYDEFLKLYEPYREEATEDEFAKILGIFHLNFQNMRKRGKRARILKIKENQLEMKRQVGTHQKPEVEEPNELEGKRHEGTTPVEFIEKCLLNGINREQAIKDCMERFDLTQEELLQEMTKVAEEKKKMASIEDNDLGEDR